MLRPRIASSLSLIGSVLVACSGDPAPGFEDHWHGEEAHLHVHGLLNGEKLDISIEGDGIQDGMTVWCEREYQAPTTDSAPDLSKAVQTQVTIAGYASVAGEERFFELEVMSRDMQSNEPGTQLAIVPRVDDEEPSDNQVWLEWEWTTLDGEDLLEAAAQKGTFVLEKFSGKPGEGGIVIPEGEGDVAGYAQARWSVDEELTISFTAPCTVNDVEEF